MIFILPIEFQSLNCYMYDKISVLSIKFKCMFYHSQFLFRKKQLKTHKVWKNKRIFERITFCI